MADLFELTTVKDRLTQRQKDARGGDWYKKKADLLDTYTTADNNFFVYGNISNDKRIKVNCDLFNNIIDVSDFDYVCKPWGAEGGELPARFTNRDIVSTKIKVLLGMEMKMPFSWRVVAINEEATTRKEEEEFNKVREYVEAIIMQPIRTQIEKEATEKSKGRKLSPDEQRAIEDQIEQEVQSKTPDEVRKYMARKHQDPAEVLGTQILQYLIQNCKLQDKFNKGWKYMNLSSAEVYHVGIFNGEPDMTVVNTRYFKCDKSRDLDYIEDGEWATCEYALSPSQVVSMFGDELTTTDIDRIYDFVQNPASINDIDWNFNEEDENVGRTIRALHTTFKALTKIGFLSYNSSTTGKPELKLVDENYRFNPQLGDIEIRWEWIPETHECWKIMSDIYVHKRPVPGQLKTIENIWNSKLPYYGAFCDNLNSLATCPMDRMKPYQYYFDIIMYRVELLFASDKGKILIANIHGIPKSAGINTSKWLYYLEANKIGFMSPTEEGMKGQTPDVTNMVKEVDMSLASQIDQYIKFAEYLERKCGACIGVTPQMEAQISPEEAVSNTRQNLVQASHIIQPYFELHNNVKTNVLTALLEVAKVAYSIGHPRKLNYILDDMSIRMLEIDQELLTNSSYGLFVANASKSEDAKIAIINLAQAAMQNQQADLLDIIKVIKSTSIQEAEENIEVSKEKRDAQMQSVEQMKAKQQQKQLDDANEFRREEWKHEEDMLDKKILGDRETKVQVAAESAMGYDVNKDEDDDGVPDVLEVAKFGVDADIKRTKLQQDQEKLNLDKDKFQHQKGVDKEKLEIDRKKANKPTSK
jgi:hypothetical protein